eukprot:m.12005 g.12005  ORF g.12005 m.12005 type:complete len:95 (-) comp2898_c0_seq1:56-340(-)
MSTLGLLLAADVLHTSARRYTIANTMLSNGMCARSGIAEISRQLDNFQRLTDGVEEEIEGLHRLTTDRTGDGRVYGIMYVVNIIDTITFTTTSV